MYSVFQNRCDNSFTNVSIKPQITQNKLIDDEWNDFITGSNKNNEDEDGYDNTSGNKIITGPDNTNVINKVSDIYISTKTIIAYLNVEIDLYSIFWKIPIIPYSQPCDGVIKKQMKFNSLSEEAFNTMKENLKHEDYYEELVITNINNPNGRVKFKDIRKISIGISKKI